jgi:excisionase family DNA binding protein
MSPDIFEDARRCGSDVRGRWCIVPGMATAPPQIPSTLPRGGLTRDQVMTAREVAELLQMPVSTVYELARRGEIPARRLGRTWRFLRPPAGGAARRLSDAEFEISLA